MKIRILKHYKEAVKFPLSRLREGLEDSDRVRVKGNKVILREETTSESIPDFQNVRDELRRTSQVIETDMDKLTRAIKESAQTGNAKNARSALQSLLKLGEMNRAVADIINRSTVGQVDESTPVYMVGSWFLNDSYCYLTQGEVEALHFVTGVQFDNNTFTLDRLVPFKMSHQSAVSAKGDIKSTHRALVEMENYGHKLHAHFHIHPGKGEGATFPSSTDMDYQRRLEKGGYAAIGGIFSRDGFLRFFSSKNLFNVKVYGKGVEKINERVFRLTEIN